MSVDCLLWEGRIRRDGYGAFDEGRQEKLAHVAVYEAQYGPVPQGWDVHHECENKACVNPHHLEAMPKGEHTRISRSKDRCKRGHLLAETRVRFPNGRSDCSECRDIRMALWRGR